MKPTSKEDGQVLVLFGIILVLLLAMAALAIDVSSVYSARRAYRTASDAAALAGGLELQDNLSRAVGNSQYTKARAKAAEALGRQLGGTPVCTTTGTSMTCTFTGTPYNAKIRTPLNQGDCVSCFPERSVQVTLTNPTYGVSFARLFGVNGFSVSTGSVAGLGFSKSYAIVTLRPPKKLGSTFDVTDIRLDGGTVVNVSTGDVGSNANMEYSGTGSIMNLDAGYAMYYYPALPPDQNPNWYPAGPTGMALTTPIADPGYQYPAMSGSVGTAPTFVDARTAACGAVGTTPACTRADLDPACLNIASTQVPSAYTFVAATLATPDKIFCYKPGVYDTINPKQLVVGPDDVAILAPGAYYFRSGLTVNGWLLGGYEAGAEGVALMFDECLNQCILAGNNAKTIALNAGTRFPPTFGGGASATAAVDWNGQLVQTSGPDGPTPPILLTLLVKKDPDCYVPTGTPFQEPAPCDAGKNKTLNMAGGGSLALEGVQYAPTDNVEIAGGSSGTGRVGQIIAWTLKYSGGTHINQHGPNTDGPGVLRLDGACTAPGTPCAP